MIGDTSRFSEIVKRAELPHVAVSFWFNHIGVGFKLISEAFACRTTKALGDVPRQRCEIELLYRNALRNSDIAKAWLGETVGGTSNETEVSTPRRFRSVENGHRLRLGLLGHGDRWAWPQVPWFTSLDPRNPTDGVLPRRRDVGPISSAEVRAVTSEIAWPDGKAFAFTVFDDTDCATVANTRPVYDLLADLGVRTTKSVWPLRGRKSPKVGGATCEDRTYLAWIYTLRDQGFEIGLHNTTYHTSPRADTLRGLDRFRELFGHDPAAHANHTGCHEGIYWGEYRLEGLHRNLYNLLTRNTRKNCFRGHIEGDELFWGDLCQLRVRYVRNFVFRDVNTLKRCPHMPYHDPAKPFVNAWFASSEGAHVDGFVRCLDEKNQDRLEAEGGACIMYTHFACGFFENGALHARFRGLMTRLSRKNGWFVPVGTLLDFLRQRKGVHVLTPRERSRLQSRWMHDKLWLGST